MNAFGCWLDPKKECALSKIECSMTRPPAVNGVSDSSKLVL